MNPHQPFPIANVESGLFQAKEPWLSPDNAFTEMNDARVFRSRIERREGFERFSQCGVASSSGYILITFGNASIYSLTSLTRRFVPESIDLTWNDPTNGIINATVQNGSFQFQEFNSTDGWGWSVVETGTSNQIGVVLQPYELLSGTNVSARIIVIWGAHSLRTTGGTSGTPTWSEDPELPITALATYRTTSGTEFLVATNTTRIFAYNVAEGWFEDVTGADEFTGSSSDLFWTWPLNDDLLLTNGIDRVKKYNGPGVSLANMGTTIGAGPDIVSTASAVIFYRNRVIYFGTIEGGTTYPGRSRWSRAGAYETLDVEDFTDAPPELGVFVTVEFVADRIMVGFQNGWMELVYTGDAQSLFLFERTTSIYGATSRLGSIADGARILARTENGIQALDPNQQYPVDVDIPDLVVEKLDPLKSGVTFGTRNIPLKQFWWTVATALAETALPDQMLVAQYQEDQRLSWSRYKIPFTCFTAFRSQSGSNWDDISTNWDDYDIAWDSAVNITGSPVSLAGHASGVIYQSGGDKDHLDDRPFAGEDVLDAATVGPIGVPLHVQTQRLSPYPGFNAHLGWVDFYMEASSGVNINVEFRGNTRLSAYRTSAFDITPSGANEKVWRRVKVNKTAQFHTLTIRAEGGGGFAIDAIIPYFRQAGRMKEFG